LGGFLGQAFSPTLLTYWPLVLLALSPIPRHMVLVAPITDPVPFVLIAGLRRFMASVLGYYLGLTYGEQGFAWVERRSARAGRVARWLERWMRRAGPLALIAIASPGLCAIAGTTKLSARVVFPCALLGQLIYVSATYALGDALEQWTAPILVFIREHVVVATVATATAIATYELVRRRRQRLAGTPATPNLPEV
jgi:membrane protein YqaA with SNARE-associated domain